ncbi:GntR family transcriptional regulator [Microbispora amethystogenes]|uniref:GntR family transcriptional regulator n=1 Tax=Microbispora amethystogenes TaxID=1427754 RepID=UPI0033EA2429
MAEAWWRVIADSLRDRINQGEFPPGSPLPNQRQLMDAYHCSTATIASATRALTAEGLIRKGEGARLIVQDTRLVTVNLAAPVTAPQADPWELACKRAGRVGLTVPTSGMQVPADRDIAVDLQVSPGDMVVQRTRDAVLDGQVVMIDTVHFPTPLADPNPTAIRTLIWSAAPTKEEAEALRLRPGTSALMARRILYNAEAQPVEVLYRVANERTVRFETYSG